MISPEPHARYSSIAHETDTNETEYVEITVLHGFGAPGDGAGVAAGVSFDANGNVYGTTTGGGANNRGTVFELTPGNDGLWTETIVYSFCSQPACMDGSVPLGSGVAIDGSGNLYGDTTEGGTENRGALFELSQAGGAWAETVLYSFCSLPACADGASPSATPTTH